MSIKKRHATIGLMILFLLIIINSFVVIGFFTNDEYNEVTYSQASLADYDNIISTKISKQNEPEVFVFDNNKDEDAVKNTNDVKQNIISEQKNVEKNNVNTTVPAVSSRSSSPRKKVEITNPEPPAQTKPPVESKAKASTTSVVNNQTAATASQSSIPAGNTSIGTIQIPKTGVNLPILNKVSVAGMEVAACFMYSTGSINVNGTTVIVGHNYNNGKLFSNNKKLGIGDSIIITANGTTKTYTVFETFITSKDDITYLERNTSNELQIALSTCTDNEAKRLVILAK